MGSVLHCGLARPEFVWWRVVVQVKWDSRVGTHGVTLSCGTQMGKLSDSECCDKATDECLLYL
jgi:hypothetical protein